MYWADKSAADHYQEKDLSAEDARRVPGPGSRQARKDDWQVSRALLHHVRQSPGAEGVTSLSHSGGHAICARAPAGWAVGADLERMRARDEARLAEWICSQAEQEALLALEDTARRQHFYLLWTLKEAFIKAAGLAFPADMASVGLMPDACGGWRLRAPPGKWHARSWRLGKEWMASVVWSAPDAEVEGPPVGEPQWRAAADCALPRLAVAGDWPHSAS
ncbi:4'-phosphopantetheinyl transferase family protein [Achromobacter pestifer]|uniref:4'-phosphopantetheinyl transferase domain-containing protein n=1 Tax=Achromobacter pestifer TaxID=1353889 RepID=A0A6S6ZLJ1_9BURK|nr:4'-phosphopantetheinyl transferase superfamily protein [Achromobacter pestifer]CAB3686382.1 hypothetical protein LMG3431_04640 [Achromobacter pestifer]